MSSEKQYTDLYEASRQMIFDHAAPVMNTGIPLKKGRTLQIY